MDGQGVARIYATVRTGTSTDGRHAAPAPHQGHDSERARLFRAALAKSLAAEARRRQARGG